MPRCLTIGLAVAGLGALAIPWALADDPSGSNQGGGNSTSQVSDNSYGSSAQEPSSERDRPDLVSGRDRKEISGHVISQEGQHEDALAATTTRPSRESTEGKPEARANVRNYSEQEMQKLSPDARFLVNDYQANLCEIQAGRMVAERARNDEVQRFARNVVESHRRANEKIRQVADRKSVALPDRVAPWQQAMLDHLSHLSDRDLGRTYVFHQVGMHNVGILEHQWVANHTRDRDIGQLAERTTGDLEHYLEMACGLATRLSEAAEGQARAGE